MKLLGLRDWKFETYSRGLLLSASQRGGFRHWLRIGPRAKG
jgi:hypothetical protein